MSDLFKPPELFRKIYFEDFEIFQKFLNILTNSNSNFYYRGQADIDWTLITTFERFKQQTKLPDDILFDYYHEVTPLESIKKTLHNYTVDIQIPEGEWDNYEEWYSILQHYGGKTRLLDFSESFYVALFFAVFSEHYDKHCAVWCIDLTLPVDFDSNFSNIFTNYYKVPLSNPLLFYGKVENNGIAKLKCRKSKRLIHQRGILLYGKNFKNSFRENLFLKSIKEIEDIEKTPPKLIDNSISKEEIISILHSTSVLKIEINFTIKSKIRDLLRSMNMDYFNLFPDYNGLIQSFYYPEKKNEEIIKFEPDLLIFEEKQKYYSISRNPKAESCVELRKILNSLLQRELNNHELYHKNLKQLYDEGLIIASITKVIEESTLLTRKTEDLNKTFSEDNEKLCKNHLKILHIINSILFSRKLKIIIERAISENKCKLDKVSDEHYMCNMNFEGKILKITILPNYKSEKIIGVKEIIYID